MTVKKGDYFSTSWGYDQTNIDYLVVVGVSPTGKTATCRMAQKIHLGESGTSDVVMPGPAWGIEFRMTARPDGRLRGSYPYCQIQSARRLDTFHPVELGAVAHETMAVFGH